MYNPHMTMINAGTKERERRDMADLHMMYMYISMYKYGYDCMYWYVYIYMYSHVCYY